MSDLEFVGLHVRVQSLPLIGLIILRKLGSGSIVKFGELAIVETYEEVCVRDIFVVKMQKIGDT